MSEEEGIEHLEEKIKRTQRSKLFNDALGYICLIISTAGVALWYSQMLSREIFIITSFIFIIGYVLFSVRSWKNNRAKKALMKQLKTIPKKTVCPKCQKEIPEGDFEFCPFCGNPLKK